MNLQPVFDLVQICHLKGIKHAVISPGSRNAALTIAFSRHPEIECYSIPDERSAAFIALGMSLKTKIPTVLICTSGSAALNYAPAVAEAYFNQVPLLILSADRPPEWIGQRDGQTIYQEELFGRHVKQFFNYPSLEEKSFEAGHQIINSAINTCLEAEMGPVHINIPFREPFYPNSENPYSFTEDLPIVYLQELELNIWKDDIKDIDKFSKVLIVVGQTAKDTEVNKLLSTISEGHKIPVVTDIISNVLEVDGTVSSHDVFLKNYKDKNLQPDLLITIGMSVISKNLKLYLREFKPAAHWHIRRESEAPDTYLSLTKHITTTENSFLTTLIQLHNTCDNQNNFHTVWKNINSVTTAHIEQHSGDSFSDFICYKKVLNSLPNGSDIHLANSMAVRYANVIGLSKKKDIEIFCNRGTSGIDGSNSTSVGTAIITDRPTFLLTGDMAFLYDRNAFWHNHVPNNLSIVVFNNHGGGIFRMIDGPSQQPELKEFFETHQQKDASYVAQEYGFEYYSCSTIEALEQILDTFVTSGKRKILEIFTDAEESKQTFKELFRNLS